MSDGAGIVAAFARQAEWCRQLGAPITQRIVAGLPAALDRTTWTGREVLDWPGDPIRDALALRLVGGLHALHRAGADAALSAVFEGRTAEAPAIAATLGEAIRDHDATLVPWLAGPPQANEVARAAVLMAGLLELARQVGGRFEMVEIGASAGLNLAMAHYGFDLGGVRVGPADAALVLAPDWRGPPPAAPARPIAIVSARGVDLAPIDLADPAAAERLAAYVWVDAGERQARLAQAVAIVRAAGIVPERGDAADWLADRLDEPQAEGVTRVLVHTVVWQYLHPAARDRIKRLMEAAGARATPERPLGWVMMEPSADREGFELRVRSWPGDGAARIVAAAHPHGAWIDTAAAKG